MENRLVGLRPEEVLSQGRALMGAIQSEVAKVCYGPEIMRFVDFLVVALLAPRGHVIARANVGVGKTLACTALARAVEGNFARVQFTPDMQSRDLTGFLIYNPKIQEWEVHHGPLHGPDDAITNIVLGDEINRATPKTQAALLEAMGEGHITIGKQQFMLPPVWLVLATRNPIEQEGTFDLPEAQLDRFLGQFELEEMSEAAELEMLSGPRYWTPMAERLAVVQPAVTLADIVTLREAIFSGQIYVDPKIDQYIVALRRATQTHPAVQVGASPRGSENLRKAATIVAYLEGSDYVAPEHVHRYAVEILAHRVFMDPAARYQYGGNYRAVDIIREVLDTVPEPGNPA